MDKDLAPKFVEDKAMEGEQLCEQLGGFCPSFYTLNSQLCMVGCMPKLMEEPHVRI